MSGLTVADLRAYMAAKFAKRPIRQWCRARKCNASHISEFVSGSRGPPSDMLTALGLEVRYVRVKIKDKSDGKL